MDVWTQPVDDVAKCKFAPGCLLERTSKEDVANMEVEAVPVEYTFECTPKLFQRKEVIKFDATYYKWQPKDEIVNKSEVSLKRLFLNPVAEPTKSVDSAAALKFVLNNLTNGDATQGAKKGETAKTNEAANHMKTKKDCAATR